jgi:predicted PhzF superfamily epimerase YddE/YHI9
VLSFCSALIGVEEEEAAAAAAAALGFYLLRFKVSEHV